MKPMSSATVLITCFWLVAAFVNPSYLTKRFLAVSSSGYTYSTWFQYQDGWVTARHVVTESEYVLPPWVTDTLTVYEGYDVVSTGDVDFSGITLPKAGDKCEIAGFPAGSSVITSRDCVVVTQRPGSNTWIVKVDEPVVVGMSGSPVIHRDKVIGVLVSANSPVDIDRDGELDFSADIVALSNLGK